MDFDVTEHDSSDELWSELRNEFMPQLAKRRFKEIAGLEPREAFRWWEQSVFPAEARDAIQAGIGPTEAYNEAASRQRAKTEQRLADELLTAEERARDENERRRLEREREEREEREYQEWELEHEEEQKVAQQERLARQEEITRRMREAAGVSEIPTNDTAGPVRISVARYIDGSPEPEISGYARLENGTWRPVRDDAASAQYLEEILSIQDRQAIHVHTFDPSSISMVAAALPSSEEVLQGVDDFDTGDDALSDYLGLPQVAIDGFRWAPFALNSDDQEIAWFKCDEEQLENERAVPAGDILAAADGIETASRTSGLDRWKLLDLRDGYCCFVAELDEREDIYEIEHRNGRTDPELVEVFADWIDWEPVASAVTNAVENGGSFEGVASDLWDQWSETCEVSAWIGLNNA